MEAIAEFEDRDRFVERWFSDDPKHVNRIAAVERDYEKIVNSLHGLIDLCEQEEAAQGPQRDDVSREMGRWRRVAARTYVSHTLADRLIELCDTRNVFQHEYPDLEPEKGLEVWDHVDEMLQRLPKAMTGLEKWIHRLWP